MIKARIITFFLSCIVLFNANVGAQIITTYVGNGTAGYIGDGGQATNAEVNQPMGLFIDYSGNLLLCQHVLVRKINPATGIISTIAGSDTATSLGNGGPATCALVNEPYAVALDALGDLYIADYWANQVRKVNMTTGIINSYAGIGAVGSIGDGGPSTAAKFNGVGCICIDTSNGFLYISDTHNHRVRKVNIYSGVITAFAGTGVNGFSGDGGSATDAKFSRVFGLGLDHLNNLYVGDWDNARIRKIDRSTGIVTTVVGNGTVGYFGDGGSALGAMINKPTSIFFDSCDNLFFSDEINHRVRRVDAVSHIITTVAGNGIAGFLGDGGAATAAEFNHPTGLCIDKFGHLFVSDFNNNRVRKITFDTLCIGTPPSLNIVKENVSSVVNIFPNPTQNELSITSLQTITSITITNPLGQTLLTTPCTAQTATLTTTHLPPGIYLIKVTDTQGKTTISKIIKQ